MDYTKITDPGRVVRGSKYRLTVLNKPLVDTKETFIEQI